MEYCTLLLDSPSPPGVALLGKQLQVSLLHSGSYQTTNLCFTLLTCKKYFCFQFFFDQTIGEDVHRSKPEKFSELLLKVRQTLVNPPPNLQSDSLATLLLLLESHLLRWPSALPEKTGVIGVDMLNSDPSMPGEWYAQALGSPLQLRKAPTMLSQPQMPRSNGHSPRVREVRT